MVDAPCYITSGARLTSYNLSLGTLKVRGRRQGKHYCTYDHGYHVLIPYCYSRNIRTTIGLRLSFIIRIYFIDYKNTW